MDIAAPMRQGQERMCIQGFKLLRLPPAQPSRREPQRTFQFTHAVSARTCAANACQATVWPIAKPLSSINTTHALPNAVTR